ncbi:MAG TPA: histidinol-phosphate transaminase [Gammaproteobacteria bacterium]|nr:histidinol-phosphate transaminase [Gammaproteobacteria bacterium]
MTTKWLKRTTAGIADLHPYIPGKPVVELERELGLVDTIKLASNENPLGPSPLAWAAIQKVAGDVHLYPDDSGFHLRHKLAERYAVAVEAITLGAGSSDVIDMVARVFLEPGVNAVYSEHSFAMYQIYTQACGAAAKVAAPLPVDHPHMPYGHDLDAMAALIDNDTRVVFIANPNNPTGTWLTKSELAAFLESVPSDVVVVLDEAYTEYVTEAEFPNGIKWLADYPNLIVTRTFSKMYGLAGLRIGYGISSPELASVIQRVRHPFNANLIVLAAAEAVLDDDAYVRQGREVNQQGMLQLTSAFDAMGLAYMPSVANFLAVDLNREAAAVNDGLLNRGIITRPIANYNLPNHLRISIGTELQNSRFIAALGKELSA